MQNTTFLPADLRARLAADPTLGCGNFFPRAFALNPHREHQLFWLERACRTFTGETFTGFSLSSLKRVADQYAAWYWGAGVRSKDPVAVYQDDGIESLIHFVALTGLGAIPILINGNMPAEIAALFLKKAGAVGLYSDAAHQSLIAPFLRSEKSLRFFVTDETAGALGRGELPAWYPFEHVDSDPVLVGHSSGTTGIPKAVVFHHQQFFYGIRYRLGLPQAAGSERLLSALPHSHSAGIAYLMLAILNGNAIHVLSDHFGAAVLEGIEQFRPTMVAAFPETWVSITEAEMGMDRYDLSSVKLWVNGGDAAHEAHIRQLVAHGSWMKEGKLARGSLFIDGMGSSEMGFSLFRHVHTPDTDDYNRCVGPAIEWTDAQALGERGEKLPPYRVGKLGVKGPSVTPGYWNDSVLTARSTLMGYQLTGDLVYRDEAGRFYHVDRIPDAIRTRQGMLYSLQTEEILLKYFGKELADCSVVGVPVDGEFLAGLVLIRVRPGFEGTDSTHWLDRFNEVLAKHELLTLAGVVLADTQKIPLGSTGKVLKRELRERFRDYFSRKTSEIAAPALRIAGAAVSEGAFA